MEFNFPKKEGTGIPGLIPHVSPELVDMIKQLLAYNADNRMSAGQALKLACFKEYRDADKTVIENPISNGATGSNLRQNSVGYYSLCCKEI